MRKVLTILCGDAGGSVAIETAVVAPVLALLALGTFDVSQMVSRQSDLQSAAAEAEAIVQAAPPTDSAGRDRVRDIVQASIDPDDSNPLDSEAITEIYRCGGGDYQTVKPACATGSKLSTYIKLDLANTYIPNWTNFGVGGPIDYHVVRMVQIS